MNTLPLNPDTWDITLDSNGNLSLGESDYSIAQDVASAIRTVRGECWYDVTLGLPYFNSLLGQHPPASLITAMLEQAAFTITGVKAATVIRLGINAQRQLTGSVILVSENSTTPFTVRF